MDVLPRTQHPTGLRGDGQQRVGAVGQFVFACGGVLLVCVAGGFVWADLADHAFEGGVQGGQRRFLVAQHAGAGLDAADVNGELHGLMRLGGAAEALRQCFVLSRQCNARRVVACGLGLLGGVAADSCPKRPTRTCCPMRWMNWAPMPGPEKACMTRTQVLA